MASDRNLSQYKIGRGDISLVGRMSRRKRTVSSPPGGLPTVAEVPPAALPLRGSPTGGSASLRCAATVPHAHVRALRVPVQDRSLLRWARVFLWRRSVKDSTGRATNSCLLPLCPKRPSAAIGTCPRMQRGSRATTSCATHVLAVEVHCSAGFAALAESNLEASMRLDIPHHVDCVRVVPARRAAPRRA